MRQDARHGRSIAHVSKPAGEIGDSLPIFLIAIRLPNSYHKIGKLSPIFETVPDFLSQFGR